MEEALKALDLAQRKIDGLKREMEHRINNAMILGLLSDLEACINSARYNVEKLNKS